MLHLGLIGFPLHHSFSKEYYQNYFKENKINADYQNYPLESLHHLKNLIAEKSLGGFNVTLPYKESICDLIDFPDERVRQTGATNCVKIKDGLWYGFNTDVAGFEQSFFNTLSNNGLHKALIFGNGGSSKAVQYSLTQHNIPFILVSRKKSEQSITYNEISQNIMEECNILINTTPLGMYPNRNEQVPIPYHYITKAHTAFDLIYNPEETLFLASCKKGNAKIKNGLEMLYIQAAESLKIFLS